MRASHALTEAAHKALGGLPGTRPLVVDPFAGGGSIPLEALRVGADAFASDLNPVAVLLNKVMLEYIPKYGQRLVDEVHKWGRWIKEEAERELAQFYPKDPDGAIPVTYLWARTIICEGPGCGAEVPLMRSLWLAKKGSKSVALRLVPDHDAKRVGFEIITGAKVKDVGEGTVRRGAVTCPVCEYTTPAASIRRQLSQRHGGAADARLLAVVVSRHDYMGRQYRLPIPADIQGVELASRELTRREQDHPGPLSLVPDETVPLMSGVFNAPIYGHNTWGSLFTPRQALFLTTLVRLLQALPVADNVSDQADLHKAVKLCLGLAIDRCANQFTSLSKWNNGREVVDGVFARQALPMLWDFGELSPFSGSDGYWMGAINWILRVMDTIPSGVTGHATQASATEHPLPDDSTQAIITDPPYYNAVPYADLSDFFYVWLKRSIGDELPDQFHSIQSPKDEEICEMAGWDPVRYPYKDGNWFEASMAKAMGEGRRVLAPNGIGVVVFAHKSTGGWEAQLQAMINAGWVVTGSWPIDTEMGNRLRAMNSAALASSVHLVCRPRENPDGSLRNDEIGDWRDVLSELPRRIHEWMPRLAQEGVVGADAIFACLGPALEVFSRYSRVEKASGDPVSLREYLEHVWAAVAREGMDMIFQGADATGFEEDARLTAMWLWTLKTETNGNGNGQVSEGTEDEGDDDDNAGKPKVGGGFTLEFDAARLIAQGLGAHLEQLVHLVDVNGDTARLLPVSERTRYLFGKEEATAPSTNRRAKKVQMSLGFVEEIDEVEGTWGAKSTPNPHYS